MELIGQLFPTGGQPAPAHLRGAERSVAAASLAITDRHTPLSAGGAPERRRGARPAMERVNASSNAGVLALATVGPGLRNGAVRTLDARWRGYQGRTMSARSGRLVGRRWFLTQGGRGAVGIAVLGLAACTGSDHEPAQQAGLQGEQTTASGAPGTATAAGGLDWS